MFQYPFASPPPIEHWAAVPSQISGLMALPPWAYGERQRLSPIVVRVRILSIRHHHGGCEVVAVPLLVRRNSSEHAIPLNKPIKILIEEPDVVFPADDSTRAPALGSQAPSPPSGVVSPMSPPKVRDERLAWLRPSPNQSGSFDLMAGSHGFGPDFEGIYP